MSISFIDVFITDFRHFASELLLTYEITFLKIYLCYERTNGFFRISLNLSSHTIVLK